MWCSPAEHSKVVAVTCIDYGSGDVSNNCHYGSKVEFAAYQRFPTVHGNLTWVDRLSGSSGAAPVVAGQAALIWSRYPYMTRAQVLDRMRWAGRSSRDSRQGYGIVNTYKAVGGIYYAAITQNLLSGGGFNQVAYYELRPSIRGGGWTFHLSVEHRSDYAHDSCRGGSWRSETCVLCHHHGHLRWRYRVRPHGDRSASRWLCRLEPDHLRITGEHPAGYEPAGRSLPQCATASHGLRSSTQK